MVGPQVRATPIPGLLVVDLPVHGDNRGWFKENWQREKMTALGLPDFGPVQHNVSFNAAAGATRGIHAEPWDKFVSVVTGRVFGAWVDLRDGETFGQLFTTELGPDRAVFVPRGVGNAFQTLLDATTYSYLVNEHWSPQATDAYTFVNLGDESLSIDWPIHLDDAALSVADREHPPLSAAGRFRPRRTLVLGSTGQLGRALRDVLPDADVVGRETVDLADPGLADAVDWSEYDVVVNAAAYTAVDAAETAEGRRAAWAVNAHGVGRLAAVARRHRLMLVHVSSDYVFDGSRTPHTEDEPFTPLGAYGQTKAAGDLLVGTVTDHYVVRTSWVTGDGGGFVRTMAALADRGASPSVVDDQVGRLTFTADLAAGVAHLLRTRPPSGTYNLTCSGKAVSWADVAATVFEERGRAASDVRRVTTAEYAAGAAVAPRPASSVLDLARIEATGFTPRDGAEALRDYLASLDRDATAGGPTTRRLR